MKSIFVDTSYWVARSNQRDRLYQNARELASQLGSTDLFTTELVLVKYLNYFSSFGSEMRQIIASTVQNIIEDVHIQMVWQSRDLFESGLDLYRVRLDKGYSLTDCVSMVVMRQVGIQEVLNNLYSR